MIRIKAYYTILYSGQGTDRDEAPNVIRELGERIDLGQKQVVRGTLDESEGLRFHQQNQHNYFFYISSA